MIIRPTLPETPNYTTPRGTIAFSLKDAWFDWLVTSKSSYDNQITETAPKAPKGNFG